MSKIKTIKLRSMADALGLCGSTICAVHCLFAPLLVVAGIALPVSFLTEELFHRAMLWVVIPAAVIAFGMGCARHRDGWVFLLGALGTAGLAVSALWLHDVVGESGERVATLISTAALAIAHVRNWRLCRAGDCAHDCNRR